MTRKALLAHLMLVAVLLLGPEVSWAARPLDTEDTDTVEPGKLELELSGDYARNPQDHTLALKAVLSLGLLPRLQGKVEFPNAVLVDPEARAVRAGMGDSVLQLKYRLLDEAERRPAVLGALSLRLPTGDETRGLGDAGVDVGLLLVLSKSFGPLTLRWNGGYTFVTDDRDLDAWVLNGAAEYWVTEAWSLVGELVSALRTSREPDAVIARAGVVYAIRESARFDAAIGFGLTRASPDVLVTVGVTFAF